MEALRLVSAGKQSNPPAEGKTQACPNDDSGLTLPAGFCVTVFADGITIVHSPARPVLKYEA